MSFLFWFSVVTIGFVYVGYPLLVWLLGLLRMRRVRKGTTLASISIIISAYNEEDCLERTIRNKLDLDYPRELCDILVVSDGSTDRTEEIVRQFAPDGVRLLVQPSRLGKTTALNHAAKEATGEILVFSDANSIYDAQALRAIVRNFCDPEVGYVTGRMVYLDESGTAVGSGCGAYMRYENLLRSLETKIGSIVGVDGGIDAVRSELYEPMGADLLPDFILPLSVIKKGYRVVFEPDALLAEPTLAATNDEWCMRVRVILRSYHALWRRMSMLNPILSGIYAFQIMTHKVLRYMVGFFQIMLFVANAWLAPTSTFYLVFLVLQIIFYVCALAGFFASDVQCKYRIVFYPYYLCLVNLASLVAFGKFLIGVKQVTWTPRLG